ncbi:hypothetical protein GCM10010981_20630 [Dyella nitratireducens]|uniref:Uncharacterized protein n=1 Tax=Dyella nitratireducens TaxID=1849580 RepID=A0ABQ1FUT3_9GAMM|nr:hypothetical protein GCM10010981_20630 [Dyella nitratireducens]GLQ42874.1 hypothetical protein GCM10007902_27240 [Dyella nitratireducens]
MGNGSTNLASDVGLISGTLGAANIAALVRAGIAIGMVEALAMRHVSPNAYAPTNAPAPRRKSRRVIVMRVPPDGGMEPAASIGYLRSSNNPTGRE